MAAEQRTPTLRLAKLRVRDAAKASAIEEIVYPRPWSLELLRAEILGENRSYVGAWLGRDLVGYAGILVGAGEAHITTVVVAPDRQRAGIATHLLARILADAKTLGAAAATLEVRVSGLAAIALYERFGFVSAGTRPRYYQDNGEDALIMWLHELDTPQVQSRIAQQVQGYATRNATMKDI